MTLPTNIILPRDELINPENPENLRAYLKELNITLQRMYDQLAQVVNGEIRSDFGQGRSLWAPTLKGTTTEGTFTYTHQTGWSLRQGLMVDVWFDVQWSSAGDAAGNLYVELPYKVALSNQKPFVGVVQSSNVNYTGGTNLVINGTQNTYRGEFWNTGSKFTTARQSVVGSGQLIGHLRYMGQQDERA